MIVAEDILKAKIAAVYENREMARKPDDSLVSWMKESLLSQRPEVRMSRLTGANESARLTRRIGNNFWQRHLFNCLVAIHQRLFELPIRRRSLYVAPTNKMRKPDNTVVECICTVQSALGTVGIIAAEPRVPGSFAKKVNHAAVVDAAADENLVVRC